jgi:crossover junction endodeoxyribonuclease RuvC
MNDLVTVGLDLSLASTGIARIVGEQITASRIVPRKLTGHDRLSYILDAIEDHVEDNPALIAVEGPSFGSAAGARQAGHHERGGLWWLVTHALWLDRRPTAVVPPATLKRYATGKGNATKDAVLAAAIRRYQQVSFDGNDQADALILAAMGADHLGHPIATMPTAHRTALTAVQWPPLPTGQP